MLVSRLSAPVEIRLPSERTARPLAPATGAVTSVYDRFNSACFTLASTACSSASESLRFEVASSYSRWLIALSAASCFRRADSRLACSLRARSCASRARDCASSISNGAGSIWKRGLPAVTTSPSVYRRFIRMPVTRARTSTSFEPSTWPTRSRRTGTRCGWTSMMRAWTGPGAGAGGGVPGPQAERNVARAAPRPARAIVPRAIVPRTIVPRTIVLWRSQGCDRTVMGGDPVRRTAGGDDCTWGNSLRALWTNYRFVVL